LAVWEEFSNAIEAFGGEAGDLMNCARARSGIRSAKPTEPGTMVVFETTTHFYRDVIPGNTQLVVAPSERQGVRSRHAVAVHRLNQPVGRRQAP
jgi:hypothetical protein